MPDIDIQIPPRLLRAAATRKRFVVIIGGRGSGKSIGVSQILAARCYAEGALCLAAREFQSSIADSSHKLLSDISYDMGIPSSVTKTTIDYSGGGGFRFKGLARNRQSILSFAGGRYFWCDEAQTISLESLQLIEPTFREPGAQLFFTGNPRSSEDAFSQRFITPYLDDLRNHGFHEDKNHLIIFINYHDNPWHGELEAQRLLDQERLSKAEYEHIWLGAFNDDIPASIIKAAHFEACIDAHKKLPAITDCGPLYCGFDPAGTGMDHSAICLRQGSVVKRIWEKPENNTEIDVNCDWALRQALTEKADHFVWDCDGIGQGLLGQVKEALGSTKCQIHQYRGSASGKSQLYADLKVSDDPDAKKHQDVYLNNRAQSWFKLSDRIYNTYRAITRGEYIDPINMISFDSQGIENIDKLRAELCRVPSKPNTNGLLQLESKEQMLKKGIASPNMGDALVMSLYTPPGKPIWAPLDYNPRGIV